MKIEKLGLIVALLFVSIIGTAQSSIDEIVKEGIGYHDKGEFDKAIETYKKALKIDPQSPLVNYEIALSYFGKQDYEKAFEYSEAVLKQKKDFIVQAAMIKGSALDVMGKTQESIEFFKKVIEENEAHYLLYYNLGVNYFKISELDKAEECFVKAIDLNVNHGSSHWLLANIQDQKGNPVQTLLAVHFFLFLEPDTQRSQTAYKMLQKNFGGNVTKDKDKPNTINITLQALDEKSQFSSAELMISMLEASKSIEENKDKSDDELFVENTDSFFTIMGELNKEEYKDIWWTFYTPFFYELAKSEHIEAYCKYITQGSNENSAKWLNDNEDKFNAFGAWLQEE